MLPIQKEDSSTLVYTRYSVVSYYSYLSPYYCLTIPSVSLQIPTKLQGKSCLLNLSPHYNLSQNICAQKVQLQQKSQSYCSCILTHKNV